MSSTVPPISPRNRRSSSSADEIDFMIHGQEMQFVEIELDPGESAIAEAGAMMFKHPHIHMDTIFGDGTGQEKGFFGRLASAGKRGFLDGNPQRLRHAGAYRVETHRATEKRIGGENAEHDVRIGHRGAGATR